MPNGKKVWVFYPDQPGDAPAILFLHGLGEAGTDINKVLNAGLPKQLKAGLKIPFIVFAPQDANGWWNETTETAPVVDYIKSHIGVNANRLYMSGLSSGADGCLRYMKSKHDDIAAYAICSINSNAYVQYISEMKGRPVRYFHGYKDISPNLIKSSEAFVRAYSNTYHNATRTVCYILIEV